MDKCQGATRLAVSRSVKDGGIVLKVGRDPETKKVGNLFINSRPPSYNQSTYVLIFSSFFGCGGKKEGGRG